MQMWNLNSGRTKTEGKFDKLLSFHITATSAPSKKVMPDNERKHTLLRSSLMELYYREREGFRKERVS